MLSLSSESIVSFSEATGLLPRRRRGKKPHVSTLFRWASRGCRGVVLESIQVGGTRCTSREALQRFAERLTTATANTATTPHAQAGPAHDHADRALKQAGW